MNLSAFFTLKFWNGLALSHLAELVTLLTATILVLMDRPIRRVVQRFSRPYGKLIRFIIFVGVCSFGYGALSLVVVAALKAALTFNRGGFAAPLSFGILILVGVVAARQKEI